MNSTTTSLWRWRNRRWELSTVVFRAPSARAEQFLIEWPTIVQARQAQRSQPADPFSRVIP